MTINVTPMIYGIGCDILEKSRIKKIYARRAALLIKRLLTPEEIALLNTARYNTPHRTIEFIAGRFCAKEAIAKSLGSGIGARLSFLDVAVLSTEEGQPICVFSSVWKARLDHQSLKCHVSISHSQDMVQAMAVCEKH